uniref:F-box/kelch-repeat protein At3g23880-like isoform X1 n=1 Tax=Fragaria vesca subsp. vesca TaxID=101020 RepID=UPI0005C92DF6|nr:PREDICTED: F-box/kelch-repeat protein At3g23880-like isoform X1 [Fragaria vesca subsp. vesca]
MSLYWVCITLSLQICSNSLKTAAMSDCLPQEVITNILLRLPAKSLVVCTSVCKSWRSMIKDSSFISAHLSRTIDFNDHHDTHLLLLHRFYTIWSEKVSVHRLKQEVYSLHYDNNDFSDCCEIGFQSPIADREICSDFFRVVGVCNGLVCLADDFERYGENFLLWNPSIRKLVSLPKPGITVQTVGGYDAQHGFAFDVVTNDYKVVRVVEDQYGWEDEETENRIFVEVYSLAAGSWSSRRIVDPQWSVFGHSPQAFVNGALHWDVRSKASSKHRYFILAFDVSSELLREMMMPESLDWDSFRPGFGDLSLQLTVSGDGKSLALFLRYHDEYSDPSLLDVWVMKEYCLEESWTKLITLHPQGPQRSLPSALCFRKSGEIVMVHDHRYGGEEVKNELVSLDLVSRQFKNLGSRRYQHYTIDPYEESLVLLDRNEAVSC